MRLSAPGLVRLLDTHGITLEAIDSSALVARPKERVTIEIAEAIRAWKPELCRALSRSGDTSVYPLSPCQGCGCEFVIVPATTCPWCIAAGLGAAA